MNNPPAFPSTSQTYLGAGEYSTDFVEGMTLRDYFAAHAIFGLIGLVTPGDCAKLSPEEIKERIAIGSYQIANAMLKERERTPTP